jgi:hypothetical protein
MKDRMLTTIAADANKILEKEKEDEQSSATN